MIEVKNLTKRYGSNVALDHVSFSVEEGTILGFLGPNGAGKSTTMNIITGYLSASEGEVTVAGHSILDEPAEVKKLIGAYAAVMGGVDAIIFTAGVGENDALERMQIASGLEYMGVKMDEDANNVRGEERVISATDSKVKVLLIPTNEELMIARDTAEIVGK